MKAWKLLALVTISAAIVSSPGKAQPTTAKLPDWSDYLEALKPMGDRALKEITSPNDPQARQEAWRILMGSLAQGFVAHVYADPDYPEFISLYNNAFNLYAPNADYMYNWTPVRENGSYRLKGYRGTNRFVDLYFLEGFYMMDGLKVPTTGSLDLDTLKLGQDGSFDVLISPARPAGYAGDWRPLPPKTRVMFMRQASYDWVHERDAIVTIERTDVPPQRPRLSAEELSRRFSELATWIENASVIPWRRVTIMRAHGLTNKVAPIDYSGVGGAVGQTYYEGLFQIADDEALIIESEVPPTCRYWSYLVTDDQFATVDWMNRQSSLNGFQARLDGDGRFRGVISNRDPGVPNWLDAGGYKFGGIQVRWNRCNGNPQPTTRKVHLSELRKYLPQDTPRVTTSERDATLRIRREGAQMRRKW